MDFEARIGERFDVGGIPVHWDSHANREWITRLRQARGSRSRPSSVAMSQSDNISKFNNAVLENVSVSGAGLRAPAEARCVIHTLASVTLGPGSSFDATVQRILPADAVGWAYFGVEFTSISPRFSEWLDRVIQTQRSKQRS